LLLAAFPKRPDVCFTALGNSPSAKDRYWDQAAESILIRAARNARRGGRGPICSVATELPKPHAVFARDDLSCLFADHDHDRVDAACGNLISTTQPAGRIRYWPLVLPPPRSVYCRRHVPARILKTVRVWSVSEPGKYVDELVWSGDAFQHVNDALLKLAQTCPGAQSR
jgi:hypothetical protein